MTKNKKYILTNRNDLYRRAIRKWGSGLQYVMVIEECSELIKAVSKYCRNGEISSVISEIADVKIMIEQLQILLDIPNKAIKQAMHDKLVRLQERLKD